jgi:hypothetical protein
MSGRDSATSERTPEEQMAWERHTYGDLLEEWLPFARSTLHLTVFELLIVGMLSDAQEQILRGSKTPALQTLNRAKYILAHRAELETKQT